MEQRILKACEGKSKSQGGLNVEDIKKILKERGLSTAGLRTDLLERLCTISTRRQQYESKDYDHGTDYESKGDDSNNYVFMSQTAKNAIEELNESGLNISADMSLKKLHKELNNLKYPTALELPYLFVLALSNTIFYDTIMNIFDKDYLFEQHFVLDLLTNVDGNYYVVKKSKARLLGLGLDIDMDRFIFI